MKPISLLLLNALIQIESGGNPKAVGDAGLAYGILQIHPAVVQDVNRVYGTHFRHVEMFEVDKSICVFHLYLGYWVTPQRLGREPTLEDYARTWNGGPYGWHKDSTLKYWERVKTEMERD